MWSKYRFYFLAFIGWFLSGVVIYIALELYNKYRQEKDFCRYEKYRFSYGDCHHCGISTDNAPTFSSVRVRQMPTTKDTSYYCTVNCMLVNKKDALPNELYSTYYVANALHENFDGEYLPAKDALFATYSLAYHPNKNHLIIAPLHCQWDTSTYIRDRGVTEKSRFLKWDELTKDLEQRHTQHERIHTEYFLRKW